MAHQSLYRRYRPQTFSQLRGQAHVTTALKTAISEGRQSHAYLFSGPRGTGKTSTARVLAKALNCNAMNDTEPCCECESCVAIEQGKSFDLHELDAASHNKVDDIRDLTSRVNLGSPGKTKVYILDEVHMLSSGAENALLKTLEEPPDHVVFILATTEPHKVAATIRSRTQQFEFSLLPSSELEEHVRWVAKDAGLEVDDEGVDYILEKGAGSARDTLSALDTYSAAGQMPANQDIGLELCKAIAAADSGKALVVVQESLATGQEPRLIATQAINTLRNAFLNKMGAPATSLSDRATENIAEVASLLGPAKMTEGLQLLGKALIDIRQAPDPRVPLETTLIKLTMQNPDAPTGGAQTSTEADTATIAALTKRIEALEKRLEAPADNSRQQLPPPSTQNTATQNTATQAPATEPQAAQAAATADTGKAAKAREVLKETLGGPAKRPKSPRTQTPPPSNEPKPQQSPAVTATGEAVSEESIGQAMENRSLGISQRARVRFKGGQISVLDANRIGFAVPNEIHMDRCAEVKPEIEQALSAHFGKEVTIELTVTTSSTQNQQQAPSPPANPANNTNTVSETNQIDLEEETVGEISELADAPAGSVSGVERIQDAFPGATVVESSENA